MEPNYVHVLGTGRSLPERKVTNKDLEGILDTSDEWITTRTGIERRGFADPKENAQVMGAQASLNALADARLEPEQIDRIIVATNGTSELIVPQEAFVIQYLIRAKNASCCNVGAGCTGGIYAIEFAEALLKTGKASKLIVVATDTLSNILGHKDRNSGVLLADGAGALVLGVQENENLFYTKTGAEGDSVISYLSGLTTGNGLKRLAGETNDNFIKRPTFYQNGKEVFRFAGPAMKGLIECASNELSIHPSAMYHVPHQANLKIIEYAMERLDIPMNKVYTDGIKNDGNTSTASYLIGLDDAARKGYFKEGDTIALTAVGAGLSWGICVFNWTKTSSPMKERGVSIDSLFEGYQRFMKRREPNPKRE